MNDDEKRQLNILIASVAAGDAEALDEIFALAGKRMYYAAYALTGSRPNAEDIVSDSFIKIARFAKKYDGTGDPLGWILTIVRNTALDFLRKRNRTAEISCEKFYSLTDDIQKSGYRNFRRSFSVRRGCRNDIYARHAKRNNRPRRRGRHYRNQLLRTRQP